MWTAVDLFNYILGGLILIWLFAIGIWIMRREVQLDIEHSQHLKDDHES